MSIQELSIQDWLRPRLENSFYSAPENALPLQLATKSGAGRSGRRSKIKDRLEALLFAETLQGTLSPNANPGKGSVGGLLNLMPKATARIQRAAQTLVHLSSTRSVIPKCTALRKGGNKKNNCPCTARFSPQWSTGALAPLERHRGLAGTPDVRGLKRLALFDRSIRIHAPTPRWSPRERS